MRTFYEHATCDICGRDITNLPRGSLAGAGPLTLQTTMVNIAYRVDVYHNGNPVNDVCLDCAHQVFDRMLDDHPSF